MLQDLHLADGLVLRDARDQLLQLGVAVVDVAQGAHRLVHARVFGIITPADGETLLRDAAHGSVAAPGRADGTDGFHDEEEVIQIKTAGCFRVSRYFPPQVGLLVTYPGCSRSEQLWQRGTAFIRSRRPDTPPFRIIFWLADAKKQALSHWLMSAAGRMRKSGWEPPGGDCQSVCYLFQVALFV